MADTIAELVFIPAPGVGHIMSAIEMAKLLVSRDRRLSITVLIINPPSSSSTLTTYIDSLANNVIQQICFINLPQDQTLPKFDPEAPIMSLYEFMNSHCKYVRKIVSDKIDNMNGSGRVVGFVVDMLCVGMIDVADEFNLPTYVFYTFNAAFLGFNLYIESLCVDNSKDHVIELSNSGGDLLVPSFVNPVPMKVFPLAYQVQDGLNFVMHCNAKMRRVKGIMVNTFLELETHAINSLSNTSFRPVVYPVGPILNLDGVAGKHEDLDLFSWLDAQPPSSVVVLCFGSGGSFKEVQVKEIAYALERCGYRFVWSLRKPPQPEQMVPGDYENPGVVLPEGFLDRTKGIGKVIGWAPQVSLLAHDAVRGFVSHCGWNSMLESLWFGVPTATWPMYAEQQLNAFEMVVELGLAVELRMDYKFNMFIPEGDTMIVTANEIETGIRRLMEDNEVRAKVKEMSKMSRATVAPGGSSYTSVDCVVKHFMSNII